MDAVQSRLLRWILEDIEHGHLINPPFVQSWGKFPINGVHLLNYIARRLPIGSIVIYEQDGKNYILDGHHRLFNLSHLLWSCENSPLNYQAWYDLENNVFCGEYIIPTNNFECEPAMPEKPLHFMPSSLLLDYNAFTVYEQHLKNQAWVDKANLLRNAFESYLMPVHKIPFTCDTEMQKIYAEINQSRKVTSASYFNHAITLNFP